MHCSWAIGDSQTFSAHSSGNRGKFKLDFYTGAFSNAHINTSAYAAIFLAAFLLVCLVSWILFKNSPSKNLSDWIYYSRFKLPFFDEDSDFDNWCLNIVPTLQGFTVGEMLILITYFISMLIYLASSSVAFRNSQVDFVMVLGDLSAIHMGISLLPVVRNSIWLHIFGISWDRALKWHRMAAKLTLLFVLLHGAIMLNIVQNTISSVSELLPALIARSNANFGLGAFIIFCFIFVTTLDYVRRNQFEVFYFSHFLVFIAILFAILHQILTLFCVIVPLILYFVDVLYRLNCYSNKAEITKLTNLEGDVVRVDITAKGLNWIPGNFVFVNIPEISYLESHPFTISGFQPNNSRDNFTLHIKAAFSSKSFTNKLSESKPSEIYIEGPYGALSLPLFESNYERLVLCAGGIGCTPAMSILQHLYAMHTQNKLAFKSVKLIWVVSEESPIRSWFPDLLKDLQSAGDKFELLLYVTNSLSKSVLNSITTEFQLPELSSSTSKSHPSAPDYKTVSQSNFPIYYDSIYSSIFILNMLGRPNYSSLFASFNQSAYKTAVFSCGPIKMMSDVREVCKLYGYHLHEETFIL